jgi:hypothetical protein
MEKLLMILNNISHALRWALGSALMNSGIIFIIDLCTLVHCGSSTNSNVPLTSAKKNNDASSPTFQ